MNVSREQEIKNVINHIEEAVWNGRHNDSKGYVVDLSNTTNKIEIWADIIEPVHESFSTEAYFKIGDKPSNVEDVIKNYTDMDMSHIHIYERMRRTPSPLAVFFLKKNMEAYFCL